MSVPTEAQPTQPERTARLQLWPLAVGLLLVGLGASGLLDDSDAVTHRYWLVPVAGVMALCALTVVATVRKLLVGEVRGG